MSKTYRPYEPDQQLLLPFRSGCPRHLAHFVSDVVDQLDPPIPAIRAKSGAALPTIPG